MTENRLGFGYNDELPEGTKAAWGARWIVTQDGGVDQVWDRQDAFGTDAEKKELFAWLNDTVKGQARTEASRLLREYTMRTREAGFFILYQDSRGIVIGNTKASAGYCYVAAYLFRHTPEGENVFAASEDEA